MNIGVTLVGFLAMPLLVAQADIIPPGFKRVQHLVEFTNISVFTNYHFFVYPRDLPRGTPGNSSVRVTGATDLSALNPLAVGRNHGVYLYAIPKELLGTGCPLESWFTNQTAGVLKSPRLVDPVRILDISDRRNVITTRYRLEGLHEKLDLIKLDPPVSPDSSHGANRGPKKSEISGLFGLAAVGVVWIIARLVRRN